MHPDGSKFATGGQGDDSGRVVIWNMAPIISDKAEQDSNTPKLLCQMDNHLGDFHFGFNLIEQLFNNQDLIEFPFHLWCECV